MRLFLAFLNLTSLIPWRLTADSVVSHKDLCIQFDNQLKFHDHTTEVCAKGNRILGMIKKSFEHLDRHMVSKLFTTLIRPTLTPFGAHTLF